MAKSATTQRTPATPESQRATNSDGGRTPASAPELPSLTPQNPDVTPRARRTIWIVILVVALIAGISAAVHIYRARSAAPAAPVSGGRGGGRGAGGDVPVEFAAAVSGDVPIYLWGLGTVTPFNTVAVRSRVDGQIMHVDYTEGQEVKEGDSLVEIDPRPFNVAILQAQGQLDKDLATQQQAESDLKRYQESPGAISEQQIAQQTALVQQYKGTVESDQAALQNAQLNLTYSKVTAPLSGRIGLRVVDEGNIVHSSDSSAIAVITQLHPIAVVFSLSQDAIPQVVAQLKAKAQLPVDAYDPAKINVLATGTLEALDNEVDVTTGTVKLKARFENQDNSLFPDQFVNARLLIDTLRGAVVVPAAAVQRGPDSAYVYVVKPDSTVEVRNIVTGPSNADVIAVTDGISPGERVVTNGTDRLLPGMKVTAARGASGRGAGTRPAGGAATRPGGRTRAAGDPTTRQGRRPATRQATDNSGM